MCYISYKDIVRSKVGSGCAICIRTLVVVLITVLSAPQLKAQAETVDTIVVSSQAQARIDFRVNLINVDGNYRGNEVNIEKVLSKIDSMVLNPHMRVSRITLVGTASPEGPYQNNVRLATGRARAFIRILQPRYSFPDSMYSISIIPEDWEGMRLMLKDDGSIPYAEAVLRFLDETEHINPDTREYLLKHLDGGKPYVSMRDNVLPYLRHAYVVVDYDTERIKCHRQFKHAEATLPTFDLTLTLPDIEPRFLSIPERNHRFLAIKTNLIGYLALCANLGFEFELWPHWSLDVPVWYSPYDITERWRIRLLAVQPEVRYWLKDAGMGHYFGVHTSVAGFNVSFNGNWRYQDPNHAALGVGIGYGYSFHLDRAGHWGLEAQIGAGYIGYKWVKYHNTGRNGAEYSRGSGTYWGITRAGLTLSYKFHFERKGRRWMEW